MTASQTAPLGFPQNMFDLLRRAGLFVTKGVVAVMIIIMAGIIAVATAAAGVALAVAAVLMGFFGQRGNSTMHEHSDNGTVTLEARKTPRGWTVE